MTQTNIITERIRDLEFGLRGLREELTVVLSKPDTNINNFADHTKKTALRGIRRKIELHEDAIRVNFKMLGNNFNA